MTSSLSQQTKARRIAGMPIRYFLICLVIVLASAYLGVLPDEMIGGFAAAMAIGSGLMWVGNNLRWFGDFGGGALLCVAVPGLLTYFDLLPAVVQDVATNWYDDDGYGFVNFLIAALITGSLLGMDRSILLRVGARFAVPVLAALTLAMGVGSVLGLILGYSVQDALLFVVIPIMGGGIGAGAIPLSEMFAASLGGGNEDTYMSQIVSAIIVANIVCIFIAGTYNALTRRRWQPFSGFNGNGRMLRDIDYQPTQESDEDRDGRAGYSDLAAGVLLSCSAFVFGLIVAHFIPAIHPYAWMIIAVALVKIFALLPPELEAAAEHWYQFVATAWIPAILVGVSFGLLDIPRIVEVLKDPAYLLLTVVTVLVASLTAGFFGWLVRMHFVESSITGGLCMSDLGGSGDVAVLGAANRMQLMPFAQMSSRLGGALVLLVTSGLLPFLS